MTNLESHETRTRDKSASQTQPIQKDSEFEFSRRRVLTGMAGAGISMSGRFPTLSEDASDGSNSETGRHTNKLRVKVFAANHVERDEERHALIRDTLEKVCRQYRQYLRVIGGNPEFSLELKFMTEVDYDYDPDASAREALNDFHDYIRSNGYATDGWIHILRVHSVEAERVSWSHHTYDCTNQPAAIVNEGNELFGELTGYCNSELELVRATYMHEVGHLLGAGHGDGAHLRNVSWTCSWQNSVMLFVYGTFLGDRLGGAPDNVQVITNADRYNRLSYSCGDNVEPRDEYISISTFYAGCALEKFHETISSYYDTENENILEIHGSGDPGSKYEFEVAENLQKHGCRCSENDGDTITGNTASGFVLNGCDSYTFSGDLIRFAAIGDVTVYLNEEEITPSEVVTEHTLLIGERTSTWTNYDLEVEADLEKSDAVDATINSGDNILGEIARGGVKNGWDAYTYQGELVRFTADGDVDVIRDANSIVPFSEVKEHTVTLGSADDTWVNYELEVEQYLEKSKALSASINDGDRITGTTARGGVKQGRDSYTYRGNLVGLDRDGELTVILDGMKADCLPDCWPMG